MKSKYRLLIGSLYLIATLSVAVGCSDEHEYALEHSYYSDLALKINNVDKKNVLSVRLADETYPLSVDVVSEALHFGPEAYIYEVGDNRIAEVDHNGTLTLLKAGETDLTVKYRGNKTISVSCKLKVVASIIRDVVVNQSVQVEADETIDLSGFVSVMPWSADVRALEYTVKQGYEDIVEMVEGSILKGLSRGQAVVVVHSTDGLDVTRELPVEVVGGIPIEEIKLNADAEINGQTFGLGKQIDLASLITVVPSAASDKRLKYEVTAGSASITDGILLATAPGEVEVTISPVDERLNAGVAPCKLSFTVDTWADRSGWFVDTTVRYSDGNNFILDKGTGFLEFLTDDDAQTFMSLLKPDKASYGSIRPVGEVKEVGFIVDFGSELEFDRIWWRHRIATTDYLNYQAFTINIYVSNDNQTFKEVQKGLYIKAETSDDTWKPVEKDIPLSKGRYVKVIYGEYHNSGSNICVGEFNIGKK